MSSRPDTGIGIRLADLVAAFSLATDLGMGQPMEHALRSWLIASRPGERMGLEAAARQDLYYRRVNAGRRQLSPFDHRVNGFEPVIRSRSMAISSTDFVAMNMRLLARL